MRTFAAEQLLDSSPGSTPDRVHVRIKLACGCMAEREVDASRVIETLDQNGKPEVMVAGKFICGNCSGQGNEKNQR